MGQTLKPIALVVEDDELQRELVAMLLEETDMHVIPCESAEAAMAVLDKMGGSLSLMFTDVNLAGVMDGVALAHMAKQRFPHLHVIVTSGAVRDSPLPEGALFMPKPWRALDLLREAERASG